MKKRLFSVLFAAAFVVSSLSGCATTDSTTDSTTESAAASESNVIKVGACVTPHSEILEVIKDNLKEEGYDLEIVTYNDYVQPNIALEDGNLDANYFQHKPYLEDFNEENDTHIVAVTPVHFEPMGIYAGKTTDLKKISKGAVVAVPNDTTNEARALLLLQDNGLITLKDGVGVEATILDIEENPYDLEFNELEAAQVAKSIQDVDIAVINGNYAIEAGLDTPLAVEADDSLAAETYANYVCVREGDEDNDKTKALADAIQSDEVRDFINDNYSGAVVPVF